MPREEGVDRAVGGRCWVSQGVGLSYPSPMSSRESIVLVPFITLFSLSVQGSATGPNLMCCISRHTHVQYIASSTGIQSERSFACWAGLCLELSDVFIEAGLVCDMCACELQDALAAKRVL